MKLDIRRQLVAFAGEFIGTFLIVFLGCGSVLVNQFADGMLGQFGVSISFGLAVFIAILAVSSISKAHLNPIVTLIFVILGKCNYRRALIWIVAQCLASITASFLLYLICRQSILATLTKPSGTIAQAAFLEFWMTLLLILVVLMVSHSENTTRFLVAFWVGLAVAICAAFGGPVSGASMNPARSLGPAIVEGHLQHLWLYLVAPLAGALVAAGSFTIITREKIKLQKH